MKITLLSTIAIVASMALPGLVLADAATPQHVRGTVETLDGSTLTVHTREGETAIVTLPDGAPIAGVAEAKVSDIKTGDFVGIASLPNEKGVAGALEVVIFPPELKGLGEGSYGWDLKPKSTMTNATVANAVKDVEGRQVTVNYNGKDKEIAIPEGTPVVTIIGASRADLVTGATVFIVAAPSGDGYTAKQVVVGKDGVVPPM
ncbi:hypothetical protein FDP22_19720 (plasmid) [Paroceanicella profunda]|uniref:DUF5666 domain-containing protein n=1 Tax=Paroceanicella profunda TaxID=2579971 RepID=A0A5B8G208_9RHOB|nr:hypothetical protein [Paroceanicella profunda]QDL94094.1 hypothetical protein FDP22_19720 [Paroceanicella profunda]